MKNCVKYIWHSGLSRFRFASGELGLASVNACLNNPPSATASAVAMQVNHSMVSGLFGADLDIEERTIMQFEPLEQDRCKPGPRIPTV